jgi:hypothetical protein
MTHRGVTAMRSESLKAAKIREKEEAKTELRTILKPGDRRGE